MKEIWINLELYFESYDFYNFLGFFFWIFLFYFLFKTFKINKKMAKNFYFSRGFHVDATWHLGPRGAYAAYIFIYFIYILYINGFSAFRIPEGYSTHKIVGCYKPDFLH